MQAFLFPRANVGELERVEARRERTLSFFFNCETVSMLFRPGADKDRLELYLFKEPTCPKRTWKLGRQMSKSSRTGGM